jgi:hypothetical protein
MDEFINKTDLLNLLYNQQFLEKCVSEGRKNSENVFFMLQARIDTLPAVEIGKEETFDLT